MCERKSTEMGDKAGKGETGMKALLLYCEKREEKSEWGEALSRSGKWEITLFLWNLRLLALF